MHPDTNPVHAVPIFVTNGHFTNFKTTADNIRSKTTGKVNNSLNITLSLNVSRTATNAKLLQNDDKTVPDKGYDNTDNDDNDNKHNNKNNEYVCESTNSNTPNNNNVNVNTNDDPCITALKKMRSNYVKNVTLGHININSVRNKIEFIHDILSNNLMDVLMISETKIDHSFPNANFAMTDYKLYRNDKNTRSGGLMLYIRGDLPHRRREDLEFDREGIQTIVIECIIKRRKWLIMLIYKPPKVANNVL